MRLFIIILLFSFNIGFAQKTVIVVAEQNEWSKTEGIVVHQKTSDYYEYLTWVNDSIYFLSNFQLDSVIIEVKNHVPYFLTGLSKISSDTILIRNLTFYPYVSEVKYTLTKSKKKLFKKEFREKSTTKVYTNSNSLDKIPLTIVFMINNVQVQAELETTPLITFEIGCNPGKNSYSTEKIEVLAEFKCKVP